VGGGWAVRRTLTASGPAGRPAVGTVPRLRDLRPWQPTTSRAMVTGMTDETSSGPRAGTRLQRPRGGRVLGGVCAAVARSLGVEPVLVRVAAVVLTMLTGGSALLAYLLAWVLIPQEEAGTVGPHTAASRVAISPQRSADAAAPGDARAAWSAAGKELRALAGELRPALEAPQEGTTAGRSPVAALDSVLTGVGERLRDPAVHASARRSAGRLAAAVSASADAVSPATRRAAGAAGKPLEGGTDRSGTVS